MSIRKRPSTKTKSGYTYQVYFPYIDSNGIRRKFFKSGFLTKKEAELFEVTKKKELDDYGDLLKDSHKTFNQTFLEYMDVEGNKYAKATKFYYLKSHRLYIEKNIGNREIKGLKYKDLQGFINKLPFNYSTVKNIKKVLSVTFSYAIKNGYINNNPMKLVTLQRKNNKNKTFNEQTISKEKLDLFIEKMLIVDKRAPDKVFSKFLYQSYAVAIFVGYYTGLRISEALALEKSDFDFDNKVLNINKRLEYIELNKDQIYVTDRMKTRSSKSIIPIPDVLIEGLKVWFNVNPFDVVICDINGNYIHPVCLQSRIREINLKVGFRFHYHMLRHTYTSNLVRGGVPVNVVQELVRHGDVNTTLNIYTHIKEEDKKKAVNDIFDFKLLNKED